MSIALSIKLTLILYSLPNYATTTDLLHPLTCFA
jgi:hypothetical protein